MQTRKEINNARYRLKRYKKANRYSFRLLAKEIGVLESWLAKFVAKNFKSPNIDYVLKVNKYLEKRDQ